jgi:hypothetical protein
LPHSPSLHNACLVPAAAARERDYVATIDAEQSAGEELKKRGIPFHPFPAAGRQKWVAVSPDFFADFIVEMEKPGKGADARKALAIWKDVQTDLRQDLRAVDISSQCRISGKEAASRDIGARKTCAQPIVQVIAFPQVSLRLPERMTGRRREAAAGEMRLTPRESAALAPECGVRGGRRG